MAQPNQGFVGARNFGYGSGVPNSGALMAQPNQGVTGARGFSHGYGVHNPGALMVQPNQGFVGARNFGYGSGVQNSGAPFAQPNMRFTGAVDPGYGYAGAVDPDYGYDAQESGLIGSGDFGNQYSQPRQHMQQGHVRSWLQHQAELSMPLPSLSRGYAQQEVEDLDEVVQTGRQLGVRHQQRSSYDVEFERVRQFGARLNLDDDDEDAAVPQVTLTKKTKIQKKALPSGSASSARIPTLSRLPGFEVKDSAKNPKKETANDGMALNESDDEDAAVPQVTLTKKTKVQKTALPSGSASSARTPTLSRLPGFKDEDSAKGPKEGSTNKGNDKPVSYAQSAVGPRGFPELPKGKEVVLERPKEAVFPLQRKQVHGTNLGTKMTRYPKDVPVMPNPPCSLKNPDVWPEDFHSWNARQPGTARLKQWPCICGVCECFHPTELHDAKYAEVFITKTSGAQLPVAQQCTNKKCKDNSTCRFHTEADCGLGMWVDHPDNDVVLSQALRAFVREYPKAYYQRPWPRHWTLGEHFSRGPQEKSWPLHPPEPWQNGIPFGLYTKNAPWLKSWQKAVQSFEKAQVPYKKGLKGQQPQSKAAATASGAKTGPQGGPAPRVEKEDKSGWGGVKATVDQGLPCPEFHPKSGKWLNSRFVDAMEKCLTEADAFRIAEFRTSWQEDHDNRKNVVGGLSAALEEGMELWLNSAWDIYQDYIALWQTGKWVMPSILLGKIKARRNQTIPAELASRGLAKVEVRVVARLKDELDFEPHAYPLISADWAADEDEGYDYDHSDDDRLHPQVYPSKTSKAVKAQVKAHFMAYKNHCQLVLSDVRIKGHANWVRDVKVVELLMVARQYIPAQDEPERFVRLMSEAVENMLHNVATFASDVELIVSEIDDIYVDEYSDFQMARKDIDDALAKYENSQNTTVRVFCLNDAKNYCEILENLRGDDATVVKPLLNGLRGVNMPGRQNEKTCLTRFSWPEDYVTYWSKSQHGSSQQAVDGGPHTPSQSFWGGIRGRSMRDLLNSSN